MQKRVGYRRNIRPPWFDAVAALRTQTADIDEIRARLDDALAGEIAGPENRAIIVQILLRVWAKPAPDIRALHQEAVDRFAATEDPADRVWLHYGLCFVSYPFFRDAVSQIGLLLRQRGAISNAVLKQRIVAEMGQLGSLENAVKGVMYILRQWQFLTPAAKRGTYETGLTATTTDSGLEAWLLACALRTHPADSLPVRDLMSWTALFPFNFSVTPAALRRLPNIELHRQGGNIDLIRSIR